jgi:hypothetical protein
MLGLAALAAGHLAQAPASAGAAATWRLEQPTPAGAGWPIGLGHVGDIEFLRPNRGLLISSGQPPTIAPGVWAYNGQEWHVLSTVCGASDGRIAWAGPDEFWTVSDGRPGQVPETYPPKEVPLEDNTLCHFDNGQVEASFAHLAFEADSYQAMHAAGCISPGDCWFAGDRLPEPQVGSFQLHWGAGALQEESYTGEGHAVQDMAVLEAHLYESVRLHAEDPVLEELPEPPVVYRINPAGVSPTFRPETELPLYEEGESPEALDYLHLSAGDGALWAAAGPKRVEEGTPGQVTVARRVKGVWRQLVGPGARGHLEEDPPNPLPPIAPPERSEQERQLLGGEAKQSEVDAIAEEPGTNSVWISLQSPKTSGTTDRAVLVRVSAAGQVLEEQTLPSAQEEQEGIGPKGAGVGLACPEANDCWLATQQGWLYHLAPEGSRMLARDEDANFAGPITYRPRDQGLPQEVLTAPPPDTSGLVEQSTEYGTTFEEKPEQPKEAMLVAPLLSHVRAKLRHGNTLELRFHLAVKARLRLIAKRRRAVVAKTPMHTLAAGNRHLQLRLNPRRWPTKLVLQSHPLAPLPVQGSRESSVGSISTGFLAPFPGGLAGTSGQR